MSHTYTRAKGALGIVIAVAVAAAMVGLVALLRDNDASADQATGAGAEVSEGPRVEPDPNEDINSLPKPDDSEAPADKSTIKPPESDKPFDPAKDFPTGIFDGEGAPTASINFVAENYWNGFLGETPITVYGGYDGYENPKNGAVFVVMTTEAGGLDQGAKVVLEGSGSLKVVEGTDNGTVVLTNENGAKYVYDLKSQGLTTS